MKTNRQEAGYLFALLAVLFSLRAILNADSTMRFWDLVLAASCFYFSHRCARLAKKAHA